MNTSRSKRLENSVLAVDPSVIFLDGLASCLKHLGDVRVAHARDQSEALTHLEKLDFQLIVLGHGLDEIQAFELCRRLRAKRAKVGIVMLSPQASDDLIQVDALAAGANVCLGLESAPEQLIETIRMVLQQRVLFALAIIRLMQSQEELTAREFEVLREMATGKTDREIGYVLKVELPTVKTHVCSILGKLHCGSRKDAVRRARRSILEERTS
jgi:DNA-binding NarL/FixJ family response regulator